MSNPSDLEALISSMSLADLARLGGTTPAAIAAYALSGSSGSSAPSTRAPKTNGAPRRAPKADATLRNDKATDALADRILAVLEKAGRPMRSAELEGQVGGTPQTRRYILKKLQREKRVKRAGVARATTYEAR